MKRNITVNIFGSLYPMDEDAYAMLNSYISNMRDYFSRQADGKEIADDIEGRVAELLSELRHNGIEAISIEHIEEIINRVGKPEQFEDEEAETINQAIPPIPPQAPTKKLFRDPEHKIFGGVFGGIGCYLGVNPVWLRLAYIIVIFLFLVNLRITLPVILLLIAGYFVCWGSIPLAANPAERLQMKGEPVNLSNMCDEFLSSTKEIINNQRGITNSGFARGVLSVIKWILSSAGILLLAACILAVLATMIAIVCAIAAPWSELHAIAGTSGPLYEIFEYNPMWLIWMCSLSLLILLVLTLFMGAHFILHITGKVKGMSTALRIICLTVWMIALIIFSASSTKIISRVSIQHNWHRYGVVDYEDRIQRKEDRKINNLLNAGWNLTRGENLSDYTKAGGHFSGDDKIRYLHASRENSSMLMEYEVDRTQKVAPGLYTLHAIGRTNGQGAEIFAIDANGNRLTAEIPVCGNEGGSLWHDAKVALEADTAKNRSDRGYLNKIAKSNDGKGYGWSNIEIANITVGPDSTVRYGVSNLSNNKTWDGTWLSATSFELRRTESDNQAE